MISSPLPLLAALVGLVALSEWLARRTVLRHLGAALLVIVLTAVAANVGLVPTHGPDQPVYAAIFDQVAPLGIFWLLLLVDLRSVARVGGPTLLLFVVGAGGTVAGALLAAWTVGGERVFGPLHHALTGMFVGTYVGGSVNFYAVAQEYDVVDDAALYAGAAAVDNAMTTIWMAVNVAMPRALARLWPKSVRAAADPSAHLPVDDEIETTSVLDLALCLALGLGAVTTSNALAATLSAQLGVGVPSALVLTTLALALAQIPAIRRLRGTRLLGLFAVYLFLAVIGALCDADALRRVGDLAPILVASQANIGGGTSALALARSLGRGDLELPAILVGSLGTALGNYLGFATAGWLSG